MSRKSDSLIRPALCSPCPGCAQDTSPTGSHVARWLQTRAFTAEVSRLLCHQSLSKTVWPCLWHQHEGRFPSKPQRFSGHLLAILHKTQHILGLPGGAGLGYQLSLSLDSPRGPFPRQLASPRGLPATSPLQGYLPSTPPGSFLLLGSPSTPSTPAYVL